MKEIPLATDTEGSERKKLNKITMAEKISNSVRVWKWKCTREWSWYYSCVPWKASSKLNHIDLLGNIMRKSMYIWNYPTQKRRTYNGSVVKIIRGKTIDQAQITHKMYQVKEKNQHRIITFLIFHEKQKKITCWKSCSWFLKCAAMAPNKSTIVSSQRMRVFSDANGQKVT